MTMIAIHAIRTGDVQIKRRQTTPRHDNREARVLDAEIGYVDEVVPADELLDRAVELGDRLARRLKFTVAAVKRAAYIGGSLSLQQGLHVENAEFLSTLASPGAQAAMLACSCSMAAASRPRPPAASAPRCRR